MLRVQSLSMHRCLLLFRVSAPSLSLSLLPPLSLPIQATQPHFICWWHVGRTNVSRVPPRARAAKVPLCEEPKVTVRHAYTTVDAALYDQTNVGIQFTVICNSKAVKAPLFFKDGDSYSPVGRQTRGTMYQVRRVISVAGH